MLKKTICLWQITSIFKHLNLAKISTPYKQTFPKCGIKFTWIFLIHIKYCRRNTNMFEHFKPLKISLSYKTYQKNTKKIMSIHTKNENMFEHFNLTNISPNKKKKVQQKTPRVWRDATPN